MATGRTRSPRTIGVRATWMRGSAAGARMGASPSKSSAIAIACCEMSGSTARWPLCCSAAAGGSRRSPSSTLDHGERSRTRQLRIGLAGIGGKSGALDAVNGTGLVVLGNIAADADGPDDLAGPVADQHAPRHRDYPAAGGSTECLDEGGTGGGAAGELAPAEPHPQRTPGLAAGDLGAQQARPVLALQCLQLTDGVE